MNEIIFDFMYNNFFGYFDETFDLVMPIADGTGISFGGWLGLIFLIVFDGFMIYLGYRLLRFVFNLFRGV